MAFGHTIKEVIQLNPNGLLGKHPSWERVRLGDIATVQNGTAFKSSLFNTQGRGFPLLRIRDVGQENTNTYYDGPYDAEMIVSPGDIVIGMDGEFRCDNWRGPAALLNQRVCRLILHSDKVSKRFISLVLPGYLQAVNQLTSAVTVKHLSSRTVADLLLPLPPRAEQERLVDAVERQMQRMGSGLRDLQRTELALHGLRVAVLTAAVTGRLTQPSEEGPLAGDLLQTILMQRREKWEREHLAKLSAQGRTPKDDQWRQKYSEPMAPATTDFPFELPKAWAVASVDQLTSLVQYGSSSKTNEDSSGIPVLRMGNIVEGRLSFEKLKFLPESHEEFPDLVLEPGDVLFNRTNSPELVGKAAVYEGIPSPCSFASYLIRARLLEGMRPEFLVYFLSSVYGRMWIASVVSQQVGQANVNGTKLRALTIPVPPQGEQDRICETVRRWLDAADELAATLAGVRREADALKRTLLSRAFSGGLLPQDPDDEPAEVLLERVRVEREERSKAQEAAKKRRAVHVVT